MTSRGRASRMSWRVTSSTDPARRNKYQVAEAGTASSGTTPEIFGTPLPQYDGERLQGSTRRRTRTSSSRIAHFSQLYLTETGKTLTADSTIGIGAFAGSSRRTEPARLPPRAVVHARRRHRADVPPLSPPVIINPHWDRHINTACMTGIRVTVLGSSGFNVQDIDPASVTLGGAPGLLVVRFINADPWLDATFVFRGPQVTLPAGLTEATVTGNLTDGTSFSSSVKVFNTNDSFFSPASVLGAQQRQTNRETRRDGFVILPPGSPVAGTSAVGAAQPQTYRAARQNGFVVLPSGSPAAGMAAANVTTAATPRTVDIGVKSARALKVDMKAAANADHLRHAGRDRPRRLDQRCDQFAANWCRPRPRKFCASSSRA